MAVHKASSRCYIGGDSIQTERPWIRQDMEFKLELQISEDWQDSVMYAVVSSRYL